MKILQSNVANTKIDFPALTRPEDLGFFSRVYRRIFGPSFIQEKDRKDVSIFIKMATMGLDKIKNVEQMRLLSALYFNLMGQNPVSRFGSHWVDIGFQGSIDKIKTFSNFFLFSILKHENSKFLGNDPATDFRGVGTFGLILLIALSEEEISKQLFRDSQCERTSFPFCVCMITLCRATLRHLKNGDLNYYFKNS